MTFSDPGMTQRRVKAIQGFIAVIKMIDILKDNLL